MHTLITTIQFMINTLIIVMLMKTILSPKEFFFSPILRPVDFIAEPILVRLRRVFRPTRFGRDISPLMAIIILLIIQTLVTFVLVSAAPLSAVIISFRNTLRFLLQFGIVCIIVSVCISPYIVNPLTRFLMKALYPLERIFVPSGASRLVRFFVLILSLLFTAIVLWHLLFMFYQPINMLDVDHESSLLKGDDTTPPLRSVISVRAWSLTALTVLIYAIRTYHFFILIIILSAIISWINLDPRNSFVQLVYSVTEPILTPFRRMIPSMGGIDFSPLIAIVLISFTGNFVLMGLLRLHRMLVP